MIYINIKNNGTVETVDEFKTFKEAKLMVDEYRLSDKYNYYYTSSRSTKQWRLKRWQRRMD